MKYCPECGKQQEPGGRFCPECGYPVAGGPSVPSSRPEAAPEPATEAPAGTLAQPAPALAGVGSATEPGGARPSSSNPEAQTYPEAQADPQPQPGTGPAVEPVRRPSPFAGVPVSDYVRDGAAVLLLLISLFVPWLVDLRSYGSSGDVAATRVDVLLVTLISILSVGVSYLWRAGVFGPRMGYRRIQDIRVLANLPYVLVALVYLLLSMVSGNSFGSGFGYLDNAMAYGLAGAVLAAQPRRAELGRGPGEYARDRRWTIVLVALMGVAVFAVFVQIVRLLVTVAGFGGSYAAGNWTTYALCQSLAGLVSVGLLALVAVKVYRGSDVWRYAGLVLGAGTAFIALLELTGLDLASLGYVATGPGFSLLFWMVAGAVVSAPSIQRQTQHTAPSAADRTAVLKPLFLVTVVLAGLLAVVSAAGLVHSLVRDFDGIAVWATSLFFALLIVAAALAAPRLVNRDARSVYVTGSVFAGGVFVLSLVLMITWAVTAGSDARLGAWDPLPTWTAGTVAAVLAWTVPFGILAALWLNKSSRDYFKSLPTNGSAGLGFTFEGVPGRPPVQTQPAFVPSGPAEHATATPGEPATTATATEPATATTAEPATAAAAEPATATTATATPADQWQSPSPVQTAPAPQGTADPDAALLAEAADPATPLVRLQELATHPRARVAVAANPSAYPDLLTWLGQLGDPAVDEALSRRQ